MKKQFKRLSIAAAFSSSVFAGTYFWYISNEQNKTQHNDDKPIAYIGKTAEDIQRRPATRLLWQTVNSGEPLFNGEAVRTSENGEVRIQFSESDRFLDLEPESLILIKKSESEIALELLEGSLFVNSEYGNKENDGLGLVLSSANGKVDLSKASAILSKSKGDSIDVQVLAGKATLKDKDGKNKEITSGNNGALGLSGLKLRNNDLKLISPNLGMPISLDAGNPNPITFQWSGAPKNSQVTLWAGTNRKNLKQLAIAEVNKDELQAKLNFGKQFLKLVASNPQGKTESETNIFKLEVFARYAPTIIFPPDNAEVLKKSTPFNMTFKWLTGEDTQSVTLEVWTDPNLERKISTKTFTKEASYTLPDIQSGTYYWRLNSVFFDYEKPVLGKIQKFTVKSGQEEKLEPVQEPIDLAPVKVTFTLPLKQLTQYFIKSPQLQLSWKTDQPERVSSYRLRLKNNINAESELSPITTKENNINLAVKSEGQYTAIVEALGVGEEIIGTSAAQTVTLAFLPLPKAPYFTAPEGNITAASDGSSFVEWQKTSDAKEYLLTLIKDGRKIERKYSNTDNSAALRNLLPGEYRIEISAIDQYGRNSGVSKARNLVVPEKSGLRAPASMKIKVK